MKVFGKHLIIELWEIPDEICLDDKDKLENIMVEAAKRSQATIVKTNSHKFDPYGISICIIVAESHLSLHTWVKERYVAIDIYTCGDHTMPEKALEYLRQYFKAKKEYVIRLDRGIIE